MSPDRRYVHSDVRRAGLSQERITAFVRSGRLLRPRRGTYLAPTSSSAAITAAREGGRVCCTTLLAELGVFVLRTDGVHVHVPMHSGRHERRPDVRLHWRPLVRTPDPRSLRVEVFDALLQAIRCQSPRAAIATVDSALNLGAIDEEGVDELFSQLPRRYRPLRRLVDGRAEAGSETLLRLALRTFGVNYDCQVWLTRHDRVDLLVEGWLVIECDSRAHHGGWAAQVADRRRDLRLAGLGYVTVRPIAADIFADAPAVARSILAILDQFARRADRVQAGSGRTTR